MTSPVRIVCASCGEEVPAQFKFCGACGAPLAVAQQQQPREERRVVTVLFADLVGSVARAEHLDPEDVQALLSPYYQSLRHQIESHGGTVEKFIGDAVVGVFGAPVAHGDDPERAVRAAIGIRDLVSSEHGLDVRVAVNTGEALVALDARPKEGEGMVAGDVINTAARLQSAAPTNGIIVGEETYRCTAATIEYDALEPLVLKGKELPVAAWEVRGAPRAPGERAAPAVELVGREEELERLRLVWHGTVAERRPQLVTIFGLPGVGKSRLVSEFTDTIRASGGRVVWGRALPYGETAAYGPFAQQVREVAGIQGDEEPALALQKLSALVTTLVDDDALTYIATMLGLWSTEEEVRNRQALFLSACRVVEALAAQEPTVLVFEDLHWADPSMLDLIEMLATRVEGVPLLLVCDARPELQERRPGWGEHAAATIALEALAVEQSRLLAERLLARAAGAEFGQSAIEIGAVAEGNPLFIEELVASLAERSAPAGGALPSSIRGIIAARLDAIPPAERDVLLRASVVGRVFWDGALEGENLPALLDSLEARDLIRRERGTQFRGQQQFLFKHALIRDVAYAALPRVKRRAIHAAVATFYEGLGVADETPGVIAYNWVEAGEPRRAIDYFVAAGDRASRSWAKREAADLYREALGLLAEDDLALRRSIRLKLAVAQQMAHHIDLADVEPRERGNL